MPRYYWWDGSDIREFFAEVNRLGSDNVRVRFDPRKGLLYVDPKDAGAVTAESHEEGHDDNGNGGFNFVHTCPPDCD